MHSQYSSCSKFLEHKIVQFKTVLQFSTPCKYPPLQEPATGLQRFKLSVLIIITNCQSLRKKTEEAGIQNEYLVILS